jgi:hypothetical protein
LARNSTMLVLVSTWRVRAVARRCSLAERWRDAPSELALPALPVVVRVELLDLLFEPGETLPEFRALGFERVDHLLNAGQVLLLVRGDLLGLEPEPCQNGYVSARSR